MALSGRIRKYRIVLLNIVATCRSFKSWKILVSWTIHMSSTHQTMATTLASTDWSKAKQCHTNLTSGCRSSLEDQGFLLAFGTFYWRIVLRSRFQLCIMIIYSLFLCLHSTGYVQWGLLCFCYVLLAWCLSCCSLRTWTRLQGGRVHYTHDTCCDGDIMWLRCRYSANICHPFLSLLIFNANVIYKPENVYIFCLESQTLIDV